MAEKKSEKQGLHDAAPRKSTVNADAYPERPYGEAISKEHKELLAQRYDINVTKSTQSAADVDA